MDEPPNRQEKPRDCHNLIENIEDNAVCSLCVDHSVRCVIVVWKGYTTSAQIRAVHETILDIICKYKLHKILGDDTALPTIHQDDQDWITHDWAPRAIAAGLRVGASKIPTSYFGRLSISNLRCAIAGMPIHPFNDIESARQWLRDYPIAV